MISINTRYKNEILDVEGFLKERPDMELFQSEQIQSAIYQAVEMINGETNGLLADTFNYSYPTERESIDENHELYRNPREWGFIREAIIQQTQFTLNLGNDFTQGSGSFSAGGIATSHARPTGRDILAPSVLKLLQKARLFDLSLITKGEHKHEHNKAVKRPFLLEEDAWRWFLPQYAKKAPEGISFLMVLGPQDNKWVQYVTLDEVANKYLNIPSVPQVENLAKKLEALAKFDEKQKEINEKIKEFGVTIKNYGADNDAKWLVFNNWKIMHTNDYQQLFNQVTINTNHLNQNDGKLTQLDVEVANLDSDLIQVAADNFNNKNKIDELFNKVSNLEDKGPVHIEGTWSDKDYDKGSMVDYNGKWYIANANVAQGEGNPENNAKWVLTSQAPTLGNVAYVDQNNIFTQENQFKATARFSMADISVGRATGKFEVYKEPQSDREVVNKGYLDKVLPELKPSINVSRVFPNFSQDDIYTIVQLNISDRKSQLALIMDGVQITPFFYVNGKFDRSVYNDGLIMAEFKNQLLHIKFGPAITINQSGQFDIVRVEAK